MRVLESHCGGAALSAQELISASALRERGNFELEVGPRVSLICLPNSSFLLPVPAGPLVDAHP